MTEQNEKSIREDSESGSTFVHGQEQPAIQSQDGPLFVLRYKTHRVCIGVFIYSFFTLFGGAFLIGIGNTPNPGFGLILLAILLGFGSICSGLMALELLLFKEIRLYSDRIVKVWKNEGELEIQLKDAKYAVGVDSSRRGKTVGIYDPHKAKFSLTNKLFFYTNHGADEADIDKLHGVLCELTGRKMEDFEPFFWGGKKWLMKKGGT